MENSKDWKKIHPSFVEKAKYSDKTYQQKWEEMDFNYEQAQQWINVGFEPKDYWEVKEWTKQEFNVSQVQALLIFGFEKKDYNLAEKWINQGYTTEQIIQLLNQGFAKFDWTLMFVNWLKSEKRLMIEQLNKEQILLLKIEYNRLWTDIDPEFSNKWFDNTTLQQLWEEEGITYSEAQEWVKIGLNPGKWIGGVGYGCLPSNWIKNSFTLQTAKEWFDKGFEFNRYENAKGWNYQGFTPQEAKEWLNSGFEEYEYNKAIKTQENGFTAQEVNQKLKPKKDVDGKLWRDAQGWVDILYPLEKRKNIKELNIIHESLTNSLKIEGEEWLSLEKVFNSANVNILGYTNDNQLISLTINNCKQLISVDCPSNKIIELNINDCEKLTELNFYGNKITNLITNNCPNLTKINACDNKLTDLSFFSQSVNLEELMIRNNNFAGSLEPIRSLIKLRVLDVSSNQIIGNLEPLRNSRLKELNVSYTNLTTGLEYLSESLTKLYCHDQQFPELDEYKKEEEWGNNYYNYHAWHKDNLGLINSIKEKKELELIKKIQELEQQLKKKEKEANKYSILKDIMSSLFTETEDKKRQIYELNEEILNKAQQQNQQEQKEWGLSGPTSEKIKKGREYLANLRFKKRNLETQLKEADEKIQELQQELAKVKEDLEIRKLAIGRLQEKTQENVSADEKKELEQKIEEWKQKVDKAEKRKEELEKALGIKEDKIQKLEKERVIFTNQKREIDHLQVRINELISLSKQQGKKIINTLSQLLPEKELLGELIKTHLEFIRYKNKGSNDQGYGKQKRKYEREISNIKDKLEDKLAEEQMDNVENILNDFEKLVEQELELEEKLNKKSYLIANHKQIANQITDNQEAQRIVISEAQTNHQQIQLANEVKAINIFINNNNTNSNTNNQTDNSQDYHNSEHNEFLQNQFQVLPKNQ